MNHHNVYDAIIKKAKLENRIKHHEIYYENHHIIPKCLNGSEEETNKVLLTAKEHFICHKLLTYIHKGNRKIICAFHKMTFSKKYGKLVSSRDYKYARKLISITPVTEETRKKLSIALMGRPFAKRGIPLLETHKKKISDAACSEKNGMYGKKHTSESIEKNRKSNTGKKRSKETKKKMAESHRGKKRSDETKNNMKKAWELRKINYPMSEKTKKLIGINTSKCLIGKKQSEETKLKRSNTLKGRKHKEVFCIYCNKKCTPSTLSRWHNTNCKFKT
jgi:hypothetical protein